jgi:GT2 family glycosyltransferase
MLRRALQRLVRLSPRAARVALELLPLRVRSALSPLIHPIAAGSRQGAAPLEVGRPAQPARYDVVVADGAVLPDSERARLRDLGHRVIELGSRAPAELVRSERVLDAVMIAPAGGLTVPFGWRTDPTFPEVTIVIPTHSARDLCRSCLHAVIRSTGWDRLQIVVVDDASSDGTSEMLREIAAHEPRMIGLRFEQRRGFAAACNAGLGLATGEYVVLLNDDTVVAPGWLSRLIAHLEADPKLGLICPVTNQVANQARIDVRYESLEQMEQLAVERAISHAGQRFEIPRIALFCGVARRELLEAAGRLDERYQIGMFEDDDLCETLRARGFGLAVARDAFVHHVGQATFGKLGDAEYLAIWEANKRRFEQKWGRRWRP